MTNYKENSNMKDTSRLEYILRYLANKVEWCVNPELLSRATVDYARADEAIDEAKQAITSLIKDLVAEAKPEVRVFDDGINDATYFQQKIVDQFEHNLLKALSKEK